MTIIDTCLASRRPPRSSPLSPFPALPCSLLHRTRMEVWSCIPLPPSPPLSFHARVLVPGPPAHALRCPALLCPAAPFLMIACICICGHVCNARVTLLYAWEDLFRNTVQYYGFEMHCVTKKFYHNYKLYLRCSCSYTSYIDEIKLLRKGRSQLFNFIENKRSNLRVK